MPKRKKIKNAIVKPFKKKNIITIKSKLSTLSLYKFRDKFNTIRIIDKKIKKEIGKKIGTVEIDLIYKQQIYTKKLDKRNNKYKYFKILKSENFKQINNKLYYKKRHINHKIIYKSSDRIGLQKKESKKEYLHHIQGKISNKIMQVDNQFFKEKNIDIKYHYKAQIAILYNKEKKKFRNDIVKMKYTTVELKINYEIDKIIKNGKKKK